MALQTNALAALATSAHLTDVQAITFQSFLSSIIKILMESGIFS